MMVALIMIVMFLHGLSGKLRLLALSHLTSFRVGLTKSGVIDALTNSMLPVKLSHTTRLVRLQHFEWMITLKAVSYTHLTLPTNREV